MTRFLLILVFIMFVSVCFADYSIDWYTIDGGGGQSSGGQYILTGTIGQPDAGYLDGDNYELLGGFWVGGPLCIVNFEDFANFAIYWLQTGSGLPADLYEDGVINYDDLLEFANVWLCICPYNWPLK
jgi:hypothetical protein